MSDLLLAGILIIEILRLLETPHWSGVWHQMKHDAKINTSKMAAKLKRNKDK